MPASNPRAEFALLLRALDQQFRGSPVPKKRGGTRSCSVGTGTEYRHEIANIRVR